MVSLCPDTAFDGQIRLAPLCPGRLEGCYVPPRFSGRRPLQEYTFVNKIVGLLLSLYLLLLILHSLHPGEATEAARPGSADGS